MRVYPDVYEGQLSNGDYVICSDKSPCFCFVGKDPDLLRAKARRALEFYYEDHKEFSNVEIFPKFTKNVALQEF